LLRSVKYGLYGAVLAGLIGGTVAWTNVDKTVHLVVDGKSQTVHTSADEVGQVVKNAGYRPGAHDLLAPSASSSVHDGGTIVFKRGRLLRLDVDGSDQFVWTTAQTVSQALGELGFTTNDFTSVSRSRRLPLGATDISVRTPKLITVAHDGRKTTVTTTDATVGQLLGDLSLTTGPDDRLSMSKAAPLNGGDTITLTRVVHKTLTTTHRIKYRVRSSDDATLAAGMTKIVTPGRVGVLKTTWAAVFVDGKLVGRTKLESAVARKPTDRLEKVGTKQAVVTTTKSAKSSGSSSGSSGSSGSTSSGPAPTPGSAQAIAKSMLKKFGWAQDQFSCLDSMWSRESGWRVSAANPSGAYGIPQALPGSKMASAGPDWQTDATTQIKWGLGYIKARYNSPCGAWSFWQGHNYY
jgi:uncharacterized protein YabE (DUF348 family)